MTLGLLSLLAEDWAITVIASDYKLCCKCGNSFPRTEEYFNRAGRYFQSYCKPCEQVFSHELYIRRRDRAYEEGTRKRKIPLTLERKREQALAYYYRHRERISEKSRMRYTDPERREKTLAAQAELRRKYPERRAAARKKWEAKNRIRRAGYDATRRARRIGARVESKISYVAILREYGRYCHLCGEEIRECDELNFDHIVPLAAGGAHARINIAPAHGPCNFRKGNRMPLTTPQGLPWHVVGATVQMFSVPSVAR